MLAAGVIGNPLLGNTRAKEIERQLRAQVSALQVRILGDETRDLSRTHRAIDAVMAKARPVAERGTAKSILDDAGNPALRTVARLPVAMPASCSTAGPRTDDARGAG